MLDFFCSRPAASLTRSYNFSASTLATRSSSGWFALTSILFIVAISMRSTTLLRGGRAGPCRVCHRVARSLAGDFPYVGPAPPHDAAGVGAHLCITLNSGLSDDKTLVL